MNPQRPDTALTQIEAEERVLRSLQQGYLPDDAGGSYAATPCPERTVDLGYGWVITVQVQYYARDARNDEDLGTPAYFVDKLTGTVAAFSFYPPFAMQGAVYLAVHGRDPQGRWPQLRIVDIAGGEHLMITVAPATTLCGITLPSVVPWRFIGTLRLEDDQCLGCLANAHRLGSYAIGSYCIRCGEWLRDTTARYCEPCRPTAC